MPNCKMDGCREPAVYGGSQWGHKRYCQAHGIAYAKKRREYDQRQKLLPECENFKICRNKVSPGHERFCTTCRKEYDEQQEVQDRENEKLNDLHRCQTVEDLKWWIEKWTME